MKNLVMKIHKFRREERGSVLLIVTVSLVVLLGIVSLAVDLGYIYATKSELQNVADAAALAGARYLGYRYSQMTPSEMATWNLSAGEVNDLQNAINDTAQQNKADNKSIVIDVQNTNNIDVKVGLWDPSTPDDIHNVTYASPDAVRVVSRRDNDMNGPVTTFIAGLFNVNTVGVASNRAVAALSGPAFVEEGKLKTPFGISEKWLFENCTDYIEFYPTTSSCAGWHDFFWAANASNMADNQIGIIRGDNSVQELGLDGRLWDGQTWLQNNFGIAPTSSVVPETESGDYFEYQGGSIASLFNGSYLAPDYDTGQSGCTTADCGMPGNGGTVLGSPVNKPAPIRAMFDYFRYRDGDDDDSTWTSTVPVYKDDDDDMCDNPSGATEILGFANIVVEFPNPPPDTNIKVHVNCNLVVIEGRGGGTTYGNLKGSIPNLVK